MLARKKISRLYEKYRELILYGLIGASGAALDYVIFLILYNVLNIEPLLATFLSVTLGITNNFFLNRHFNFKVKDKTFKRFLSFYLVGLFGIVLSMLAIFTLHNLMNMDANVAKLISIPPIVLLQYFFNKKYSFGTQGKSLQVGPGGLLRKMRTHPYFGMFIITATVSFLFGIITATNGWFADEDDNILGGLLINNGMLPYTGFFSHHAPLTYFISSLFTFFSNDNLAAFRIMFFLALFTGNILIAIKLYRDFNRISGIAFIFLTTILAPGFWMHMLLAESIIAPLMLVSLLLVLLPTKRSLASTLFWLFVIFVVSSLLNPIYSIIYIVLGIYLLFRDRRYLNSLLTKKNVLISVTLLILVVATALLLMKTSFGKEFVEQYITFNAIYYAPFSTYSSSLLSLAATPIKVATSLLANDWQLSELISLRGSFLLAWALGFMQVIYKKKYGLAIVAFVVMSFTQVRDLVYLPAYSGGAHHAIIWLYLSIAMVVVILPLWYQTLRKLPQDRTINQSYLQFIVFLIATVSVFGLVLGTARSAYISLKTFRLHEPNALITNREVAKESEKYVSQLSKDDTFWAGPLRFEAYFSAPTKSASEYTFYLPWHANCPECQAELLNDIRKEQPKIILWESSSIAGVPTKKYALPIYDFLASNYIKSKNPKLAMYYFKNAEIMQKVEESL